MKCLRSALLLAAIIVRAFHTETASAAAGVNVGILNCTIEGGVGWILWSSKGMECTFRPVGGPPEYYVGSVRKYGLDIGVTNVAFVSWMVFAPGAIDPDALAGSYVGASGEASVGLGLGANVLIGGTYKSIALQPVSVQGQTGLNLAVAITRLDLEYAE